MKRKEKKGKEKKRKEKKRKENEKERKKRGKREVIKERERHSNSFNALLKSSSSQPPRLLITEGLRRFYAVNSFESVAFHYLT